jgi:hypothetical protein
MLQEKVRSWFGGPAPILFAPSAPDSAEPPPAAELPARAAPAAIWHPARIDVCEELWGEGFLFPGGADETMRLARPLGLTSAASLLLVGAGTGGAPRTVAAQLGVWVTGYESDPDLAALAMERNTRAGLGRRAQVEMWYPELPSFRSRAYHPALALEPLRHAKPEPLFAAVTEALKPGGQVALTELVADRELDPSDPIVAAWCRVERRTPDLRTEHDITRILGRLGYDVRVAEDITQRHMRLAMIGWRNAVRKLRELRPAPARAALLVAEAELWLLRLRLAREGRIRMVRWPAFGARREIA